MTHKQKVIFGYAMEVGFFTRDEIEEYLYDHKCARPADHVVYSRRSGISRIINNLIKQGRLARKDSGFVYINERQRHQRKRNRRRYYLHQRIKKFVQYSAYSKQLEIDEKILSQLKPKEKDYLDELNEKFGYNLQYNLV